MQPRFTQHTLLWIGGLIVLAIGAYWPTSAALWDYWTLPYMGGQGFFIAALAVWLLYRARGRLATAPIRPSPWALVPLLGCSLASIWFWKAGIQTLHVVLLPLLILLAVLTALGPAVARRVAAPICYLYFAMSGWNLLGEPLRILTLRAVSVLGPVAGLPATVNGSIVSFPNGAAFEVTSECSGVGFLVQALAVAALLGELEDAPLGRRARLLGSMAVVAIVANWVRVLVILEAGYSTGMRHLLVSRGHLWFGAALFVVVLFVFVWIATRGKLRARPNVMPEAASMRPASLAPYVAAVVGLTAGPALAYSTSPARDEPGRERSLQLPLGREGWHGPVPRSDPSWRPVFVGLHAEWQVDYADADGRSVELLAVGYPMQQQGRELVNGHNSVLGPGLTPLHAGVARASGQPYVDTEVVDAQDRHSVIWTIYDIGGRPFVTGVSSQLWYGLRSLYASPYSAVFALRVECVPSCAAARTTLASFARTMGPMLAGAVLTAS